MYQYSLSSSGGTSADAAQCRLVEARSGLSTIDVATRARWRRRCVRQGCLRYTTTRCRHVARRAQMSDNVDSSRRCSVIIDVAARARWRRRRVHQCWPRCVTTRCCRVAGCAQISDNVDSSRRAVQCRPSTSLLVHGGAAADCAKVAYDVPVLAVVVWRDERRCRTMSTRRGAQWTTDDRPRCPCTMAPPSCAPRLPMMYQCSLWWNGGPRADV
jgi:hypothetical protein